MDVGGHAVSGVLYVFCARERKNAVRLKHEGAPISPDEAADFFKGRAGL